MFNCFRCSSPNPSESFYISNHERAAEESKSIHIEIDDDDLMISDKEMETIRPENEEIVENEEIDDISPTYGITSFKSMRPSNPLWIMRMTHKKLRKAIIARVMTRNSMDDNNEIPKVGFVSHAGVSILIEVYESL